MKSGDRLNQIEPLIAEMLIKLDETAAKVDKVSEIVAQLRTAIDKGNTLATKQSDTISFILRDLMLTNDKIDKMSTRMDGIDGRLDGMDGRFDRIDSNFDEIKMRLAQNETSQQEIKSILTLLKNKN